MKVKLSNKKAIETDDITMIRNKPIKLYDEYSKKPFKCNYCIGMKNSDYIPITKYEYKKISKILKRSDKE